MRSVAWSWDLSFTQQKRRGGGGGFPDLEGECLTSSIGRATAICSNPETVPHLHLLAHLGWGVADTAFRATLGHSATCPGLRAPGPTPLTALPKGGGELGFLPSGAVGAGRSLVGLAFPSRPGERMEAGGMAALLPRQLLSSDLLPFPWDCLALVTRGPSSLLTFPEQLPRWQDLGDGPRLCS